MILIALLIGIALGLSYSMWVLHRWSRRWENRVSWSVLLENAIAVSQWQLNPDCHPLTCGNDSHHPPLYPDLSISPDEARLVLRCHACDFKQTDIPPAVLEEYWRIP